MSFDSSAAYLDEVRRAMRGHKRMAESAIAQLRDDELFRTLDAEANSVAVLMKHIAGNARSRFTDFLTSDGEKPDRFRDREFEMNERIPRDELMRMWEAGWEIVLGAIASLKPEDVGKTITIRQEPHTVMQALNRATLHYAQHVGQIVLLA